MLIAYNLRSLRDRPRATLGALLSLAIAVFVYACTHMIVAHIAQGLARAGSDRTIIITSRGASDEGTSRVQERDARLLDTFDELVMFDGGARCAAELVVPLRVQGTERRVESVTLRGVSSTSFFVREMRAVSGRPLALGSDEVMIGHLVRERLEQSGVLRQGRLRLSPVRELSVVGEFRASNQALDSEVWMDLQAARAFFADASATSSITAVLRDASVFDAFTQRVSQEARLDVTVERERQHYGQRTRGLSLLLEWLSILVAAVLLLAAIFGAATTMFALVRSRQREVGTLKALGFERVTIMRAFILETLVLSLVAYALGMTAASLMRFVDAASFTGASGEVVALVFSPTRAVALSSLGVALLLGALSGYVPALFAARISPMEAIRG